MLQHVYILNSLIFFAALDIYIFAALDIYIFAALDIYIFAALDVYIFVQIFVVREPLHGGSLEIEKSLQ